MGVRRWDDIQPVTVRAGVWRKVVSGRNVMLSLNEAQPGMAPRPHHHPEEQIFYVLRGRARFHLGDEIYDVEPGSVCVIPPNVVHYSEVVGREPALFLDAFSPIREDYLPRGDR